MGVLGGLFGGDKNKKDKGDKKSTRTSRRASRRRSTKTRTKSTQKKPAEASPPADDQEDIDIDLSSLESAEEEAPAAELPPRRTVRGNSTTTVRPDQEKTPSEASGEAAEPSPGGGSSISRRKRSSMSKKLMGNLLVAAGAITENQLKRALSRQEEEGGLLGQILVKMEACQPGNVGSALNKQRTITTVEPAQIEFDQDALDMVSRDFCIQNRLIPFEKIGPMLCVAMSNVLDSNARDKIKEKSQAKIKRFDAAWPEIEAAISEHYDAGPAAPEEDEELAGSGAAAAESTGLDEEALEEIPVIDLGEDEAGTPEPAEPVVEEAPQESAAAPRAREPAAAPLASGDEEGPQPAIPVDEGFFRRVTRNGELSLSRRWLAERAAVEPLPAEPYAGGNGHG